MSAGSGLNAIFTHFKSNTEDIIFLAVDVSVRDDSTKIVDTYKTSSGITPLFPIVLTTGNSLDLTNLFGKPTTGGPSWIMHPNREFTSSGYSEASGKYNIQKALDDDCNKGETKYTLSVLNGSGSGNYLEGTIIELKANTPPAGKIFDIWSGDTEYLSDIDTNTVLLTMPSKELLLEATYRDSTGEAAVTSKSTQRNTHILVSNNSFTISVPQAGLYTITAYTLNGRILCNFTTLLLSEVKNRYTFNDLSSALRLITVKGPDGRSNIKCISQ